MTESTDDVDLTATLPCPPWCTMPAGHPFTGQTVDNLLCRDHSAPDVTALIVIGGDAPVTVNVDISAPEYVLAPDGPVVRSDPPRISVFGVDEGDPMSATDARRLAAGLLTAADRLDAIVNQLCTKCSAAGMVLSKFGAGRLCMTCIGVDLRSRTYKGADNPSTDSGQQ